MQLKGEMKMKKAKMWCWESISVDDFKKQKWFKTTYKPCSPITIELQDDCMMVVKYLRKVKIQKKYYKEMKKI